LGDKGHGHNEECRARFGEIFKTAGIKRLSDAEEKWKCRVPARSHPAAASAVPTVPTQASSSGIARDDSGRPVETSDARPMDASGMQDKRQAEGDEWQALADRIAKRRREERPKQG
jgi:hypothetical protein